MKILTSLFLCSILSLPMGAKNSVVSDSLGLPGENLNLYSVLDLFQKSSTLELFERRLNEEDSKVNNLDLNGDGTTDYIHVVDNVNGGSHAIVLQIDLSKTETQDVAVIEVEKGKDNQLFVQIIGDEALYGKDYIVEPNEVNNAQETPNPGFKNDAPSTYVSAPVATWTIVGYMYQPYYVVYSSPYRWGYYPTYWHTWRQRQYSTYYGYSRPYNGYYRRTTVYRAPATHGYYGPRRKTSKLVINNRVEKTAPNKPVNDSPKPRSTRQVESNQPIKRKERTKSTTTTSPSQKEKSPRPEAEKTARPMRSPKTNSNRGGRNRK